MSTLASCIDCTSIMDFPKFGFGHESGRLTEYYNEEVKDFRKATTLDGLDEALQTLDELYEESLEEGWDGYQATRLSEEAYVEARRLLSRIPMNPIFPKPDIVIEPDGDIALEWSKDKRQIFSASVGGQNQIVFAGLFGTNKIHGVEYLGDSLPKVIVENLIRLYL